MRTLSRLRCSQEHVIAYRREIDAVRKAHVNGARHELSPPTKEPDVATKGKLILVGADKGGVGKTMISRLLIDWIGSRPSPFTVFDTESALDGKTSLRRFRSEAKVADIGTVAGQMQIFDDLERGGLSLVDMRAGMLSQTLRTMRNAGLLDQADAGRVQMTVVHVLGSSTQSMSEVVDVSAMLGGDSAHVILENHANDGQFFKWDESMRATLFQSVSPAAHIAIPHLDAQAGEDVDRRGLGFQTYVSTDGSSDYLRRVVRHWSKVSCKALDDANLSKIVGI
jgi:hypothetical protein